MDVAECDEQEMERIVSDYLSHSGEQAHPRRSTRALPKDWQRLRKGVTKRRCESCSKRRGTC